MLRKRLLEPPTLMKTLFKGAPRLAVTGALALSLSGGFMAASAPAADAAISSSQGVKAVSIASTKKGTPYRWGATGPRAFDCSGFTSWTYKRMGKKLPRTADAQYRSSIKIGRGQARPGDLVFYGKGRKHHVGIYAGNGRMWHAPRTGDVVKLAKVRKGASFGRVR
ncbi:NlpC/P60 family protein [Mobilicoccus sp.]|uniref:C40 family peptidase n=1 Tax=Mobilicoccus sp. TaxID=2034349 RepID=UPI0028A10500|nr:NlpC/P60 family protein [Mobilicoccus sp.]